jgi:DNA polymerase (family 10)
MDNSKISARIKRLSNMMRLLNENPFKIRAFENAAATIENHPEAMGVLIDEDRLKQVPGIGESLAKIILHYAKSGGAAEEIELIKQLPPGLPELLDLPGLGPAKISLLWKKYGISDPASLRKACESGAIQDIKGFTDKLSAQLLQALDFKDHHAADFLLDTAQGVAQKWQQDLQQIFPNDRVEITGALRRLDVLIQSVDFLIDQPLDIILSHLNKQAVYPEKHPDYLELRDPGGMFIRIFSASEKGLGLEQLIRTAGHAFEPAIKKVTELYKKGTISPALSEQDICKALDMAWVEPEMRDLFSCPPETHAGLVSPQDIKGVFHAHSTWSDGRNSLEEMVLAVSQAGYEYFGISEHSQAAYYANGLQPERVLAQWDRIDELNQLYPHIHIFKGIEADILKDGALDYEEELLAGFDFVIASIHSHFHLDPVTQTDRLIRALSSPFTTMLGHPTGRMLLSREGYGPDLNAVIDAAAEYGKIIEINSTPKRLDLDWHYLKYAAEKGVRVSINPDAHRVSAIQTIPLGVMMARKGGLSPGDVINTRSLADVKVILKEARES